MNRIPLQPWEVRFSAVAERSVSVELSVPKDAGLDQREHCLPACPCGCRNTPVDSHLMETDAVAGPVLKSVSRTDDQAVRALFAEQRSMLSVIRENKIWDWLGGVPSGFGNPKVELYSLYLGIASVALLAIALIVAGFTRGAGLWVTLGLAIACLVVRPLLTGPPTRKTLELFARGEQMPAIVLGIEEDKEDVDLVNVAVLVGTKVQSADELNALVVAGGRLRDMVGNDEPTPADLQSFVQSVREHQDHVGGRVPAPPSIGNDYDVAFLMFDVMDLPSEEVDSQLLFVFADPQCRDAEYTRIVSPRLWGHGAQSLCDSLPLEEVE